MASRLFDSVIVGFDGSDQSADALALGRLLAAAGPGTVVLAYITDHQPPFERQSRIYAQARREKVDVVLEPALTALQGRDVESASIDSSSPARGLHDLAFEYCKYGVSVLAIGSTHRGSVGRVVLGSVGEVLVSGCPCPVAVAPKGFAQHAPESLRKIVAGFDGTAESRAAVREADRIARATGADLELVAVAHQPTLRAHDREAIEVHRDALQGLLDEALAELDGRAQGDVVDGDPVERLIEAAEGADLMVVGARGYGPHRHVLVGTVSSRLMRTAPSPVLIVPRPAPDELDGQDR